MPALPGVLGAIRVALIGTYGEDSLVVNRFYIAAGDLISPPTSLDSAAAAIAGHWNTDLATRFHTSYTLTEVICEDLTDATAPVGAASVSHAGTLNGTRLTAATCMVIKFKIPRRYRGGHPRIYLSVGDGNQTTDNQTWSTTFAANVVSSWQTFIGHVKGDIDTAYSTSGSDHINVSYYEGFENVTYPSGRTYPRAKLRTNPVTDVVSEYSANPKIASQRRRNLTP